MAVAFAPERAVINSHDSEAGRWEVATRRPEPRLRPYFRVLSGYKERTAFTRRLEVPHPAIVLIINFATDLEITYVGESKRLGSFVAGLHHGPVTVASAAGVQHGMQVNLTPLGAYQLFGLPMWEVANRSVDLRDIFGPSAASLVEQLRDCGDWDAAFDLLEMALLGRLEGAPSPAPGIAWAWRQLVESAGDVPVADLANGVGCSPKHLITQFREQLGLPPKTVARIVRFDRVAKAIRDNDQPDWLELVHANGYYDQAHLIREFREFAGTTPTGYLAARIPGGGGFTSD